MIQLYGPDGEENAHKKRKHDHDAIKDAITKYAENPKPLLTS